jgi:hypothetical protein
MKYTPKFTKAQALEFARLCGSADLPTIIARARAIAAKLPKGRGKRAANNWRGYFLRFADALSVGAIPFAIFALDGNSKLPFAAFSTLPIVTCPGAGECAGIGADGLPDLARAWCYSLRAWRYPAAFLRQCQNTILIRFRPDAVAGAFAALPRSIVLRLYVDGDIDSAATARFWFALLKSRPDVCAYGYSKSLDILDALAGDIPPNYTLNLSSGGRFDGAEDLRQRLRAQQFTRGDFVAVRIEGDFARGFARYSDPAYHRAVRAAAERDGLGRVFSCPGQCGSCTARGHACGTRTDSGAHLVPLTIAIGVH